MNTDRPSLIKCSINGGDEPRNRKPVITTNPNTKALIRLKTDWLRLNKRIRIHGELMELIGNILMLFLGTYFYSTYFLSTYFLLSFYWNTIGESGEEHHYCLGDLPYTRFLATKANHGLN